MSAEYVITDESEPNKKLNQMQIELKMLKKNIRKLVRQRNKTIQAIRRASILKHLPINQKVTIIWKQVQQIIEGTNAGVIDWSENKQFNARKEGRDQKNEKQQNAKDKVENSGCIFDYWKKVLLQAYQKSMKEHDLQLLEYLQEISVKQYSQKKVSLAFSIRPGHSLIPSGTYIKILFRHKQGEPSQYGGQVVSNMYKMRKGFLKLILSPTRNPTQLCAIQSFLEILCCELLPRSLNYYLENRVKESPQLFHLSQPQLSKNVDHANNGEIMRHETGL